MVGEVGKAKVAAIEQVGEDEILERIASGVSVRTLMKEFNVGYKLFAVWLDSAEGRRGRYEAAQHEAGHFYAERAVDTAQNAQPEDVNVSRLKVDTDKWMASKMNAKYDTRQRDVAINISVSDLHAQAAQLLDDVIEGEAEEVER
jgi:hypothetical protein